MLGLVQTFRKLFQNPVRSRLNTQEKRRLEVELLEDRCLLSGNVAPMLSGRAFIDAAHTGRFHKGDPVLPGVTVTGPFVRAGHNLADVHLASGASRNIDLAGVFSAPDITTSEVTFQITAGGKTFALRVELFDAKAPQTVANFLDYVHSSAYG